MPYTFIIIISVLFIIFVILISMLKRTYGGKYMSNYDDIIKLLSCNYTDQSLYHKLFNDKNSAVIEYVQDIKLELPYVTCSSIQKPQVHLGQRKLLLSEIQFLTKIPDIYCIYAGAAPGNKTNYLAELFPNVKFILIDPNEFNINISINRKSMSHRSIQHDNIISIYNHFPTKSNKYADYIDHKTADGIADIVNFIQSSDYNIYIIEDYMTDILAEGLVALGDVSFISDIRSNIEGGSYPTDLDIYWNSAMQYNWINILQPKLSMLKMRMPFNDKRIDIPDFVQDVFDISMKYGLDFPTMYHSNTFEFSKSQQYIQAWPGISSTEMRFHISHQDINDIVPYDIEQIEQKFFYYNSINRGWIYHDNDSADKKMHFCHCNDCALENKILTDYGNGNVHKMVREIDFITTQPLNKRHTINIYKNYDGGTESITRLNAVLKKINNRASETKYKKTNQRGTAGIQK